MLRIGLISDTHGLLRPQALDFLRGSDHILHAGDIGGVAILAQLAEVAPVTAVLGNNDGRGWPGGPAETAVLEPGAVSIYMLHDLNTLAIDPAREGFRVVVAGHSHRPGQVNRDGVLYVNPGSAGPRRFRLPISVGELLVDGETVTARLVELDIAGPEK